MLDAIVIAMPLVRWRSGDCGTERQLRHHATATAEPLSAHSSVPRSSAIHKHHLPLHAQPFDSHLVLARLGAIANFLSMDDLQRQPSAQVNGLSWSRICPVMSSVGRMSGSPCSQRLKRTSFSTHGISSKPANASLLYPQRLHQRRQHRGNRTQRAAKPVHEPRHPEPREPAKRSLRLGIRPQHPRGNHIGASPTKTPESN